MIQLSAGRVALAALAAVTVLLSPVPQANAAAEVNLYSFRQPQLIQPIIDRFQAESGIKVNVVYAEKGLLERLKAEGDNSPADLVLTADVGNLNDMVEAGVLQPVRSAVLEANVPAQYRDPEGLWFGLTVRARVVYAGKANIQPVEVARYEDLADSRFKGRVCSRSGKHVYMVSLIAAMIAEKGEAETEHWLLGVKENLARKPQGNDRAQAKAIAEGECDVALGNSYYFGAMQANPEEKAWADAITLVFPNQADRGTHVNVSGGAVTRAAKNRAEAVRLLEYLSGDEAQRTYAEQNFEYPVKPGVAPSQVVASWGSFKADPIPLIEVAQQRAAASRLVDKIGFDEAGGS
ncbi:MAG TPA: Fe(3+) ABC transporter substrate-binding protein [Rhodospirillales bacterium]|nr:Fe(3+) ABC transporter substrate-binding protein [Rhodospirillales bacterium]